MALFTLDAYEPLNCLKPFAERAWIVDGPVIEMTYPWAPFIRLPFQTRMTVVQLANGEVWLHSPTAFSPQLAEELEAIGPVRYLIAPNKLHFWWLADWQAAFPEARTYASPQVAEYGQGKREFRVDVTLSDVPPRVWDGEIDQTQVAGSFMTETIFFHLASKTLILTDLIENFEPAKVPGRFPKMVLRASGAMDPDGSLPFDLRASFKQDTEWMQRVVEEMIAWAPERIIMAHGRPYTENAVGELKRAFRWVGKF